MIPQCTGGSVASYSGLFMSMWGTTFEAVGLPQTGPIRGCSSGTPIIVRSHSNDGPTELEGFLLVRCLMPMRIGASPVGWPTTTAAGSTAIREPPRGNSPVICRPAACDILDRVDQLLKGPRSGVKKRGEGQVPCACAFP